MNWWRVVVEEALVVERWRLELGERWWRPLVVEVCGGGER